MDNLIERARLTDEEMRHLSAVASIYVAKPINPTVLGYVNWMVTHAADVMVAKALWGVVDWLAERERTLFPQEDRARDGARLLVQQYTGELLDAGIERPGVPVEN